MSSTKNDDSKVLTGFNKGEPRALKYVFDQFYTAIYYFANKLISDTQVAEEISVDSFNKLWKRHEAFETLNNIKAFLYITTRNACFNFLQQRKRQTEKQKEADYYLKQDNSSQMPVDYDMIQAEVMREIYSQVEILPPKCKEVFKLIFIEGLTTAEIAARMDTSPKTVLNQKQKAIKMIKQELLKRKLFTSLLLLDLVLEWKLKG